MQENSGDAPHNNTGIVREVSCCRVCGCSDLVNYLDLGMMPLANNLAATAADAKAMSRFPMQVQYCREMAKSMRDSLGLKQDDLVVDITGNDGHYWRFSKMRWVSGW